MLPEYSAEKRYLPSSVNADMSRSSLGRLNIQERQIACEPIDRISAHGSGRPVFISDIQVRVRRIEINRRWTRCGWSRSRRRQSWSYEPQDG